MLRPWPLIGHYRLFKILQRHGVQMKIGEGKCQKMKPTVAVKVFFFWGFFFGFIQITSDSAIKILTLPKQSQVY